MPWSARPACGGHDQRPHQRRHADQLRLRLVFGDHEGEWIGYHSYIARYLDRPLSMFMLSNRPDIKLGEVANLVSALYR
jgi:hypothetical protein